MGCLTLYFVHLRLYSYIMITHIRVASQQLEQPRFESPKELVSWMGAIQAQEYEMAKWAIGIRLRSSSLETVNEALYKGDILRTHVMRPTWHFVAAEDIRWMLMLSSERIKAAVMSYAKGHFGKIEKTLFTRCLDQIGKIGQGADEYLLQDGFPVFWTDDASGTIYVQTEGQRILRFDADGSPLEHINLPEGMSRLQGLSVIGNADDLYFYQKTLSKKNEDKIFSYNIPTGKLQTEIANQDDTIPFEIIRTPIILGGYGNTPVSTCCLILYLKNDNVVFDYSKEPCLWTFGDQVYLKENFNDTIYCVSDQSLEPRYVFDLGDRHWPYEERFHPEGNEDKIGFNYVLEGEKVLFFVFQTNYYEINYKGLGKDETYWGIYDKRNGRVKVMAKGKISDPANGLFVKSFQTATAEGELAGLLDIAEVKEWIKENPFKENNQVRQLLSDLPDESNPVAVIIE